MDRSLTHQVPGALLTAWGISGASIGFGVVAMSAGVPFIGLGLMLIIYLSVRDSKQAGVGMLAFLAGAGVAILATTMVFVSGEVGRIKLIFTAVGLLAAAAGILGISLAYLRKQRRSND